jgi:mRNA-degrading endonuclease RelE of RelBE toxin-antitoxin system
MSPSPFPIAWAPSAKRALERLPEKVAAAAVEFIYGTLAENPQRVGKPLRRELEGLHSARRGDFRIVYRISDKVTIVAVDHRADVYCPR